ncbi:hypothetical protein RhiJN_20394 [Ceratobasidium sp. AG-Ba]|nr:hypothetical protein RhiJN_20394 [Ceratobasidium sp. AG-Ba]
MASRPSQPTLPPPAPPTVAAAHHVAPPLLVVAATPVAANRGVGADVILVQIHTTQLIVHTCRLLPLPCDSAAAHRHRPGCPSSRPTPIWGSASSHSLPPLPRTKPSTKLSTRPMPAHMSNPLLACPDVNPRPRLFIKEQQATLVRWKPLFSSDVPPPREHPRLPLSPHT